MTNSFRLTFSLTLLFLSFLCCPMTIALQGNAGTGGSLGNQGQSAGGPTLDSRISVLEAGRGDLSAWATLFIGTVTVVLGANVVLTAAQASSLGRTEVAKVIKKYDRQFSGFITQNEELVTNRLLEYEKSIADLSRRLDEMSAAVNRYSSEMTEAVGNAEQSVREGIERLQREGERLRDELRRNT